ncbi:hypothetical protein O6H91_05G031100 [Diphasiastrum complanatum]|nr:hypothetical protein O6H91_05G031100 [Diphasiastrum complanatum]
MHRTERVLNSVVNGVDEKGISFQSLKDVTTSFLEVDQEVVNVILNYKKDVWANNTLFQLVTEYFENSLATLDFCDELDKCIKKARENQMLVQVAVNLMPKDDSEPSENQCERVLHELNNFVAAGNPFSEEFFEKFRAVYVRQVELQKKLQARKKSLDRKLKFVKGWMKVSTIIFAATCAAVLICAVVAAAMAAPHIVGTLAAFATFPLESMGMWFRSLWTKYETQLQQQRDIIHEAHSQTFVVIKELDTIKLLVNRLKTEVEFAMHHIKFGTDRGDPFSVKLAMEQLSIKQTLFIRDLSELEEHVDRCSTTIRNARAVVLRRIVKRRSASC